jgi:hypothetical protein
MNENIFKSGDTILVSYKKGRWIIIVSLILGFLLSRIVEYSFDEYCYFSVHEDFNFSMFTAFYLGLLTILLTLFIGIEIWRRIHPSSLCKGYNKIVLFDDHLLGISKRKKSVKINFDFIDNFTLTHDDVITIYFKRQDETVRVANNSSEFIADEAIFPNNSRCDFLSVHQFGKSYDYVISKSVAKNQRNELVIFLNSKVKFASSTFENVNPHEGFQNP